MLAVVAFEVEDDSWRAYLGPAVQVDEATIQQLAQIGAELSEQEARGFFPQLANRRYYGSPDPNFFELVQRLAKQMAPFPLERLLVVMQGSSETDYIGQRHVWSSYSEEQANEALALATLMAIQQGADAGWREAVQIIKTAGQG